MGSATHQLYSLSWGDFGSSLATAVQLLRGHGDLVDVTLAAGGKKFSAHKIVLCAASPFLLEILKSTPCQHPVVMLAGIEAEDLEAILEFVYQGEVKVDPSQLPSLLQAAHCLSIHGLTPPTIMTDKGIELQPPSISNCHENNLSKETIDTYLSQRRKKKKKKSSGGGKWPKSDYQTSLDTRSLSEHSDDNRSIHYGHKSDDSHLNDEDSNSKSRTLSDQPTACPLCGAVIRQSRNLRRHLELLHFGAGSGGKSGSRIKKESVEKELSKTLTLKNSHTPKSDAVTDSTMSSLNLSSPINSNTSHAIPPGPFALSSTSTSGYTEHLGHDHNQSHNNLTNLPLSYPPVPSSCPSIPTASLNNGLYSSDSASMLSCLLPTLPSLPSLSSPHDVFRHSEFFRASIGLPQDSSREQLTGRYSQRTHVS
ncbi:hypothetical protein QAD02_000931 [Eretmocerus hayati]|uniref:Uncharacterized protein n=1 Tax=Eretmocerus hayati TaxID=131215 RepID=A0ACC2NHE9_9HYME|nr:hypothetical protein QAD02_000931 [Eretmocerus hayati]